MRVVVAPELRPAPTPVAVAVLGYPVLEVARLVQHRAPLEQMAELLAGLGQGLFQLIIPTSAVAAVVVAAMGLTLLLRLWRGHMLSSAVVAAVAAAGLSRPAQQHLTAALVVALT
jgi:hypothetical protein